MGFRYRQSIKYGALRKALRLCCRNTRWKPSTAGYEYHAARNTLQLCESLDPKNPTYKIDKYQRFWVYEPKKREIVATRLKDRQFQRSLCDGVLYPALTKSFLADNCACQKDRGVDYALDRMTWHLQRFYQEQRRAAGNPLPFQMGGYALQCDIHHFFESIRHDEAIRAVAKRVKDREAVQRTAEIINSFSGDHGIGLGSQISQLVALTMLDDMDHMIKEQLHIRHYIRYMDDFLLFSESKEHLQHCLGVIRAYLQSIGLTLNKKTSIYPLSQGVTFLHWHFLTTDTGKVIRRIDPKKIRRERRKLRALKALLLKGERTMEQVREHYKSASANIQRGNTRNIKKQLDAYYISLFHEPPPLVGKEAEREKRKKKKEGTDHEDRKRGTETEPHGAPPGNRRSEKGSPGRQDGIHRHDGGDRTAGR